MAVTLTTKVAQVVKATSGKGTTIFNDKLQDGTRSLKVWGWTPAEYTRAKVLLEELGAEVNVVEFMTRSWRARNKQIRLHVVEPA